MAERLRAITYLAPGLPETLFHVLVEYLARCVGREPELVVDSRLSGPERGGSDPFSQDETDIGFLCAPPYLWLREQNPSPVQLIEAGLVFNDPRNRSRPAYFSDVIVRADANAREFADLRGATFAYNDSCSLSGYYSLLRRLADISDPAFLSLHCSGSHLHSIDAVLSGTVDAAAIDSNVIGLQVRARPDLRDSLRIIESWGPFAMQPLVARATLSQGLRDALRAALLEVHRDPWTGPLLREFGVQSFVPITDEVYASERQLLERCEALAI
jgi:phosphonate transport system substrate-binding protein